MIVMEGTIDYGNFLTLLLFALSLSLLLIYFWGSKLDPKEPPSIPQPIPIIGHLLGLIRHGTQYYAQVRYLWTLSQY